MLNHYLNIKELNCPSPLLSVIMLKQYSKTTTKLLAGRISGQQKSYPMSITPHLMHVYVLLHAFFVLHVFLVPSGGMLVQPTTTTGYTSGQTYH